MNLVEMPQEEGIIIAFEGIEGCGKSIQHRKAIQYYEDREIPVVWQREPGGTYWGDQIRAMLLGRDRDIDPVAEVFAFFSSRAQLIAEVIKPAVDEGSLVLLDRYIASSYSYQGFAMGLGTDKITTLCRMSVVEKHCIPDLTVLVSVPIEVGLARKGHQENEITFYEKQVNDYHRRVVEGYQDFMSKAVGLGLSKAVAEVDGTRTPEEVNLEIISLIDSIRASKSVKSA